ncbi:MAG: protein-glutamate O-methyltransferase CheR [Gammaproteobacteria bacterium]
MDLSVSPEEYAQLSEYLSTACGIELGTNKQYLVNSRLKALLARSGCTSIANLLSSIRDDGKAALGRQLIDAMTTHETLWFRDQYPFEALKRMILPELARVNLPNVRMWSAACSSGQEPYSISMIVEEYRREYPKHPLSVVQIVATDISPTILKFAKEGIYEDNALARGLTSDRRARFFDEQQGRAQVKDFVRQQVVFQELNLISPLSIIGKFHVVFCRNVLIYFSDKNKSSILERIANIIEPGGYLFLGGSESISRYTTKFEVARYYGGMVFRLK